MELNNTSLRNIFFAVMTLISFGVYGSDLFTLTGEVRDKVTGTQLFGTKAELFRLDDNELIGSSDCDTKVRNNGVTRRYARFSFYQLSKDSKYRLRITAEKHDTAYVDINPEKLSKRQDRMTLDDIMLPRNAHNLAEVTVKATRVQFYHKGDTIIYNADAFQLAEGSMLDALISQLPGAEIKDDGRIYVNGRFVENLLLNGKDFFRGNNQLMLENLAAYTVKNVAVYDKQKDTDKIMGKNFGEKEYTMDVRLKKEYSQGFMANMEAGYGSSDRFLGRLFAMWFSDNARVTLFGNANNLSDKRKPGQDTGFTPATMTSGDFRNYTGGLDYQVSNARTGIDANGEVMASYTSSHSVRNDIRTNFLPSSNTYDYSFFDSRNKQLNLSTSHRLFIEKKNWNLDAKPSFNYVRNNNFSYLTAATFSRDFEDISVDFIDSIFNGSSDIQLKALLNRNRNRNKKIGHSISGDLRAAGIIKLPNQVDALEYEVSGNYLRNSFDRFERFDINFGDPIVSPEEADRYFHDRPNYNWNAGGKLLYVLNLARNAYIEAGYLFRHKTFHAVSELYRLDQLYSDVSDSQLPFTQLPSVSEYTGVIDYANSYISHRDDNSHSGYIFAKYFKDFDNGQLSFYGNGTFTHRDQKLHYMRGEIDQHINRIRNFIDDAGIGIDWDGSGQYAYLNYNHKASSPDLVALVDMRDDVDPLNIKLGSPDLKDSETHSFSFKFSDYRKRKFNTTHYVSLQADIYRNLLANAVSYDPITGVRTSRFTNINGNWETSALYVVNFRFRSWFSLNNRLAGGYYRSADLVSLTDGTPQRSIMNNTYFSETLSPEFRIGKQRIGLTAQVKGNFYRSPQDFNSDFNSWDMKYGINGVFNLPLNFSIATDFTIYSRRGYSDQALNKDNFVWNARLSYSVMKGNLVFMVDGFDILHDLSNIFTRVNSQARTETYTNVLPHYVMFHVQWKFLKSPKKK